MRNVKMLLHAEAFSEMKKLRLLIIRNAKVIGSPPSYLSDELKWLECHHSSSSIVPSTFHPKKLVVLDISHYPIWQLTKLKGFENLRRLILVNCEMLTEIGDISSMPKLVELKIIVCLNLECFSNGGLKGKSLVNLCFMACPKLKKFPDILEEMGSLEWLNLEGCGVTELPTSIEKLTALKSLNLNMCEDRVHLSSSIYMLKRLEYISLDNSKRLEKFPQFWNSIAVSSCSEGNHIDINHHSTFGISLNTLSLNNSGLLDLDFLAAYNCFDSLKFLYLSNTKIRRFPRGMSKLKSLQVINLNHCKHLEDISNLPSNIVILDASGCNLLAKHDHLLNIFHIGYLCQDWKQVFLHQAIYNNKSSAPFVLPGSVIPNFIAHCSRGCPVTLEVTLHMEQNIKGIILCGVFDPKNDSYHYIEVEINGRPWKPINIYLNLLHPAEGFWPYKSDHLWDAYCNLMVSNLKKLLKNNPGHLEVAVFKVTHRPKQRSLLTNCAARLVFDVQNEEQPYFW